MREIKFRAWINGGEDHNYHHVMVYDLAFEKYAPINKLLNDIKEGGVLMQYTGIKDKNGVEVYEGDLLKWGNRIFKVCYDNLFPQFLAIMVAWSDGSEMLDEDHKELPMYDGMEHCKVIGNLYENRELLSK